MSEDICMLSATEQARRIRAGLLSPVDLMDASLARIEQVQRDFNPFCFVYAEEAMEAARNAEEAVARDGDTLGPLHGLPIAIKDFHADQRKADHPRVLCVRALGARP